MRIPTKDKTETHSKHISKSKFNKILNLFLHNAPLLTAIGTYSFQWITTLYRNITGVQEQFNSKTDLRLIPFDPHHVKFMSSLKHRMPELDRLEFYSVPPFKIKCFEAFLTTHFPSKVREFHFNNSSSLSPSLPLFIDELVSVSQRVWEGMSIYNFEVSQPHLVTLLAANRTKEYFGMLVCKLSLSSVPDF